MPSESWRTTAFVGDEADRYIEQVSGGLDNWQEIAGRKVALGQDPFRRDEVEDKLISVGDDPFPMLPVEPGMLSVGARRGRDPFLMTPTNSNRMISVGDDPFPMLPAPGQGSFSVGDDPFLMTPADGFDTIEVGRNPLVSVGDTVRAVAAEVQRSRPSVPPLTVVPFSEIDNTPDELVDVIVGASMPGNDLLRPPVSSPFPLTESLFHQFAASSPNGKMVRLDDEESYADFRERGFAKTSGSGSVEQVMNTGGGPRPYKKILLSLHPDDEDCIDCWQQDDTICCSMRVLDNDGKVKIATACTPVADHVQEVTGYVQRAGLSMVDVLGVLPHLVGMLGGGSLIPKLASAAPSLLDRPEVRGGTVFVGKMQGGANPSSTALLTLLQMAQSGDPQARMEWSTLASAARSQSPGLAEKMKRVQEKLVEAQAA